MESSGNRSIFQNIRSRELHGFRVRKRACFADDSSRFSRLGAFDYGVEDDVSPPMALSFCKTSKNAHILAVTGEDGYVCLYNTRLKFSSSSTSAENAEKARKCEWLAHENAVFDVCWIKDDTNLLTACADHSIKVWDSQEKKCLLALTGHTGSVKSISAHPSNNGMLITLSVIFPPGKELDVYLNDYLYMEDIIVSGSRDGSFALWDLRCSKSTGSHSDTL
ncbi:hypothetical protein SSX86_016134 [Deinandra increscens subsp. villosa]|uniref:Peroxin-7 n=1 Tax=Deinandra increscens subsp. villosa TaxID=3103831 RepID=A0AAP0GY42_9ASTR